MGVESKRPLAVPAPTETDTTNTPDDQTTELSKAGDEKSSYSLPEDGSPVTIRTRGHVANRSQTSLLIEYFEGGKDSSPPNRKPSVRVRLTPSKKSRGDRLRVTETKGARKASLTRRIPLTEAIASREIELVERDDAGSMTSYASATEESNVSRHPIDIEIDRNRRRRRPASPLIPTTEPDQLINPSELSAIPTDSFLDGSRHGRDSNGYASPTRVAEPRSAAPNDTTTATAANNAATFVPKQPDANGKLALKHRKAVAEKSKTTKTDRDKRSKSRVRSRGEPTDEEVRSERSRSRRAYQESNLSAADSSVLSSTHPPSHRSLETRSARSVASKSSINNPKLLETVEDAIRRLILPELSALKREQSKRHDRRASLTSSSTSLSKDDHVTSRRRRRRSSNLGLERSREAFHQADTRVREARHLTDDHAPSNGSGHELDQADRVTYVGEGKPPVDDGTPPAGHAPPIGSATATNVASLARTSISASPQKQPRERRRRPASRAHSREDSDGAAEDEGQLAEPMPPMPLMSDINPSEVTRTSILSAMTDRPHSASEELLSGKPTLRSLPSTPSHSPTRARTPVGLQLTLGTNHANVSHGDLRALPRGNRNHEQHAAPDLIGRSIHVGEEAQFEARLAHQLQDEDEEDEFGSAYFCRQDVPPPLKYVPYQAGTRGLSPIASVSGYTEGGSEIARPQSSRDLHSPDATVSPGPSLRSDRQLRSVPSQSSARSSSQGPASGSTARDDAHGGTRGEHPSPRGRPVRGLGASPNIVYPSTAVESAVASLVDGSLLEASAPAGTQDHGYPEHEDYASQQDEQSLARGSRSTTPEAMLSTSRNITRIPRQTRPVAASPTHSHNFSEFEIDEHGHKVPCRPSPTASEAAITVGAVGAAAAALKAAQGRKQEDLESMPGTDGTPAGVVRNRSFRERTMQGNGPAASSPSRPARGGHDWRSSTADARGKDDDTTTTEEGRSGMDKRVDQRRRGDLHDSPSFGRATPTQPIFRGQGREYGGELDDFGAMEAAGAAALGAAAGMAATHHHEAALEQDEWRRTSDERKRDTLITNPYEDTSPINNPTLNDSLLATRGLDAHFHASSPGFGTKYDEGYMSNGPNRTPEGNTKGKSVDFNIANDAAAPAEDPFFTPGGHARHLSGMSQGMTSPFYDGATGAGIDRIENKDIVALMQHRSARDTEIVALLMNAALEMRNSFREMKELVQDTGDDMIFASGENTDKLQKAMSGPRPYPGGAARSQPSSSQAGPLEETAVKKKNIWRRALQGLSAKGTNDLSRIEDMLMHLLGEVDALKMQTARPTSMSGPDQSLDRLQPEGQNERDLGYEPEGESTPSQASRSGHYLATRAQGGDADRAQLGHRISTVEEEDDEGFERDGSLSSSPQSEQGKADMLLPSRPVRLDRGGTTATQASPQAAEASEHQAIGADVTPRNEKGRKHKSGSSSGWLPKISRWSETTASSVGRVLRGSANSKKGSPKQYDDDSQQQQQQQQQQRPSRSGSSLALALHEPKYAYDPQGDDKLHSGFSEPCLVPTKQTGGGHHKPSSPLGRIDTSVPEDARYKAHRNSLNLQHPQPRPGQSERHRTVLETSAQEYNTPITPRSAEWAGSATSLSRLKHNVHRLSSHGGEAAMDDFDDGGDDDEQEREDWTPTPTPGPPRPPKEPMERSPSQTSEGTVRLSKAQDGGRARFHTPERAYEMSGGATTLRRYSGSPKTDRRRPATSRGLPARRPTGPRAMTPRSLDEEARRGERRRRTDTVGSEIGEDVETF